MLALEDPGGEPLARLLGQPMEIGVFLRLAVGVAAALGKAHKVGLVHKDILVNCADGALRLTGFGIATRLSRERRTLAPPETIAGTLAYMAPEQTRWMNRSIDSRSDLYSLGVIFYQMLVAAVPFTASDPMEWFTAMSSGNWRRQAIGVETVPARVGRARQGEATRRTLPALAGGQDPNLQRRLDWRACRAIGHRDGGQGFAGCVRRYCPRRSD